jgi:hypothetical protein
MLYTCPREGGALSPHPFVGSASKSHYLPPTRCFRGFFSSEAQVNAGEIIHQQIEEDGTTKTIRVYADDTPRITIAFPHEYTEPRTTPLHFFNAEDEARFKATLQSAKLMRLFPIQFQRTGNAVVFKYTIRHISCGRGAHPLLTISLPVNAALDDLLLFDPRIPVGQIERSLHKDEIARRYTIYVPTFDIENVDYEMRFIADQELFDSCAYSDPYTVSNDYPRIGILDGAESREVQILLQNPVLGDQYFVNQAGAVGPDATADRTTVLNGANSRSQEPWNG